MISNIFGKITEINNSLISIKTSFGLSFDLMVPNASLLKNDSEVSLETFFYWSAENGPSLFGFLSKKEKRLFELIIECQGIGPKMAISILNQVRPEIFVSAIKNSDAKTLSSINGIGPKKAENIILQLKNKNTALDSIGLSYSESDNSKHFKDLSDVLSSLNYSKEEIICAVRYISDNFKDETMSFDMVLRKSLSFLSKKA